MTPVNRILNLGESLLYIGRIQGTVAEITKARNGVRLYSITWDGGKVETFSQKEINSDLFEVLASDSARDEEKQCLKSSVDVLDLAQDLSLPVSCLKDSNSNNSSKLTLTANQFLSSNFLECQSTMISERLSQKPENITWESFPLLANLSVSRASDLELKTSEIVSQPLSESSNELNLNSLPLKMLRDSLVVPGNQVLGEEPTSTTFCVTFLAAGMMSNGQVLAQDTLEAPLLESGYYWLDSPGALSSVGRSPGQSKLEATLKAEEHLQNGECINPVFLEDAFEIPLGWSDPLESRSVTQLLESKEKRLEIASILAWQRWHWLVFCTLIAFWKNEISLVCNSLECNNSSSLFTGEWLEGASVQVSGMRPGVSEQGDSQLEENSTVLQPEVYKPEQAKSQGCQTGNFHVRIGHDDEGNSGPNGSESGRCKPSIQESRLSTNEENDQQNIGRSQRKLERRSNNNGRRIHKGEVSGASESQSGRVCSAAHLSNGEISGQIPGVLREKSPRQRGSSPHQSQQTGQPDRKSTVDEGVGTPGSSLNRRLCQNLEASQKDRHRGNIQKHEGSRQGDGISNLHNSQSNQNGVQNRAENNLGVCGVTPSAESSISTTSTASQKTEEELTPVDKTSIGKHFWFDANTVPVEVLSVHDWKTVRLARVRPWWVLDEQGKRLFPDVFVTYLSDLVELECFACPLNPICPDCGQFQKTLDLGCGNCGWRMPLVPAPNPPFWNIGDRFRWRHLKPIWIFDVVDKTSNQIKLKFNDSTESVWYKQLVLKKWCDQLQRLPHSSTGKSSVISLDKPRRWQVGDYLRSKDEIGEVIESTQREVAVEWFSNKGAIIVERYPRYQLKYLSNCNYAEFSQCAWENFPASQLTIGSNVMSGSAVATVNLTDLECLTRIQDALVQEQKKFSDNIKKRSTLMYAKAASERIQWFIKVVERGESLQGLLVKKDDKLGRIESVGEDNCLCTWDDNSTLYPERLQNLIPVSSFVNPLREIVGDRWRVELFVSIDGQFNGFISLAQLNIGVVETLLQPRIEDAINLANNWISTHDQLLDEPEQDSALDFLTSRPCKDPTYQKALNEADRQTLVLALAWACSQNGGHKKRIADLKAQLGLDEAQPVVEEVQEEQLTPAPTVNVPDSPKQEQLTTLSLFLSERSEGNWERRLIDPNTVILDPDIQSRDKTDGYLRSDAIAEYSETMREGRWILEREPLPAVVETADGHLYAIDHHRVAAATEAGIQLLFEVIPGTPLDARIESCRRNHDHSVLPLTPKDQRSQIEMFLDILDGLTDAEQMVLLKRVPNISEYELSRGQWSNRLVARFLKFNENVYKTVGTIRQERVRRALLASLQVGDRVEVAAINVKQDRGTRAIAGLRGTVKEKHQDGVVVAPDFLPESFTRLVETIWITPIEADTPPLYSEDDWQEYLVTAYIKDAFQNLEVRYLGGEEVTKKGKRYWWAKVDASGTEVDVQIDYTEGFVSTFVRPEPTQQKDNRASSSSSGGSVLKSAATSTTPIASAAGTSGSGSILTNAEAAAKAIQLGTPANGLPEAPRNEDPTSVLQRKKLVDCQTAQDVIDCITNFTSLTDYEFRCKLDYRERIRLRQLFPGIDSRLIVKLRENQLEAEATALSGLLEKDLWAEIQFLREQIADPVLLFREPHEEMWLKEVARLANEQLSRMQQTYQDTNQVDLFSESNNSWVLR